MSTAQNTGLWPLWPVTVDVYHAMAERGILHSGDPVELLDGVIVQKPVKNPPRAVAIGVFCRALEQVLPDGWFVQVQDPVTLSASEPEPDLSVIRGSLRRYRTRHPGPREIGLVVQIAETSLERDRVIKKRIYAEAGIPFYWLRNLKRRALEVYSEPEGRDYTRYDVLKPRQTVDLILDGKPAGAIRVSELLP